VSALIKIGGYGVREALIAEIPRYSIGSKGLVFVAEILLRIDRREFTERVLDHCIETATSEERKMVFQAVKLYLDPKKRPRT
jgi:hypothetical protein